MICMGIAGKAIGYSINFTGHGSGNCFSNTLAYQETHTTQCTLLRLKSNAKLDLVERARII